MYGIQPPISPSTAIPVQDCVAAGDSNNDAAMLRSDLAFVLVANASGDLLRAAEAAPQPHHYRAGAGHADGFVEGIQHFRARRAQA